MLASQKKEQLNQLVETLKTSNNFALVKFDKTTHIALEGLRKELRSKNAKIKVVKNSLLEKALNILSSENKEIGTVKKTAFPVKDTTAILTLGEQWSDGLSVFKTYTEKEKSLSFKIGFLDKTVYSIAEMKKIADLPGRDALIGKLLGSLKAPISRTTRSMKFNAQKLVYILNAKAQQA